MQRIKHQPFSGESTQKLELLDGDSPVPRTPGRPARRRIGPCGRHDHRASRCPTTLRTPLPAQLHELFLPSGNNETPLTIAGALAFGFSKIAGDSGRILLRRVLARLLRQTQRLDSVGGGDRRLGSDGSVSPTFLQADFLVNDWLTIIAGLFVAPIGFFNERLNNPWINKLPGRCARQRTAPLDASPAGDVDDGRAGPRLVLSRRLSFEAGIRRLRLQWIERDAGDCGNAPTSRRGRQPREHDRHLRHHFQ